MLGAICGDVAGSVYEHHNIKYVPDKNRLIRHGARFTDDSVMTLAVAEGIILLMMNWCFLKKSKNRYIFMGINILMLAMEVPSDAGLALMTSSHITVGAMAQQCVLLMRDLLPGLLKMQNIWLLFPQK